MVFGGLRFPLNFATPRGRGGPSALMTSTAIVAYLALFATVGFLFVLASLLLGKLVRSCTPTPDKKEIYECGEPSIGPGYVQFDLRFYVVALVFLIFEVEVAMFFPTAVVFGKARELRDPRCQIETSTCTQAPTDSKTTIECAKLNPKVAAIYQEFGVAPGSIQKPNDAATITPSDNPETLGDTVRRQGDALALTSMLDLAVFFAVLLMGFAFVWWRGDLNWVRATRHPATPAETAAMAMKLRGNRRS